MKVAIIGSGIAGLTAAWLFHRAEHAVTLYELHARPGMDAHVAEWSVGQHSLRADVPPRIFNARYWANLAALYEHLGVESDPIDATQSFSYTGQPTFLNLERAYQPRFENLPQDDPRISQIMQDVLRLKMAVDSHQETSLAPDITLHRYLEQGEFSTAFIYEYLYPILSATVCTCSYASLKNYPAGVILEILDKMFGEVALKRVKHGTQDVVSRLLAGLEDVRFQTKVLSVTTSMAGVTVRTNNGQTDTFDHIIVATQANQARRFLTDLPPAERQILSQFTYETIPVVVHQDETLMPPKPAQWSHINLITKPDHQSAMCSVWMNRFNPAWQNEPPLFQTINPLFKPDPAQTLQKTRLQRPVVTKNTRQALQALDDLHQKPGRRIWFCGSYASYGVPLLESAVVSSLKVAQYLGLPAPWPTPSDSLLSHNEGIMQERPAA